MSDCDRLNDALAEGSPLDGALREHARSCPRCAPLAKFEADLDARLNPGAASDEMPAFLREAIAREGGAVAPFSIAKRAAVPLLVVCLLVVKALVMNPRPDLAHQPAPGFVALALALAATVVFSVFAALHRGPRNLGVAASRRLLPLLLGWVVFEVLAALTTAHVEGSVAPSAAERWHAMLGCGVAGSSVALVVAVAMFAVSRRTAATAPAASGAALGGAAGFAGTLVLHLACAASTLDHVMVGHAVPVLLGAALGALAGRKLISV